MKKNIITLINNYFAEIKSLEEKMQVERNYMDFIQENYKTHKAGQFCADHYCNDDAWIDSNTKWKNFFAEKNQLNKVINDLYEIIN